MVKISDFRGIQIFHDNFLLHNQGYLVAGAGRNNLGCPVIIVDDYYMNASDVLKNFIMMHEYMHLYHNINTEQSRKFYNSLGMVDPGEYKVDEFAACEIGKENAIIALREMMRIPGIDRFEIWKRKRKVKKLKEVE